MVPHLAAPSLAPNGPTGGPRSDRVPASIRPAGPRTQPLPGEFERQSGLLLDCGQLLCHHEKVFVDVVAAAHESIPIIALAPNKNYVAKASSLLRARGVPSSAVRFAVLPIDSMWLRDYGPIFLRRTNGSAFIVDCDYTATSGDIRPRLKDDGVPRLFGKALGLPVVRLPLDFDGGNLLSNGDGICVTTVDLVARNYGPRSEQGRKNVAKILGGMFGFRRWVFLKLLRDEPTRHVDIFVTFTAPNVAVVGQCDPAVDPVNAEVTDQAAALLNGMATSRGPMKVHRIPMPPRAGKLWRSYTNVIYANGTLLMPTFRDVDPALQDQAMALYAKLLPGWKIVGIRSDSLVPKTGLLHCISRNVPSYVSLDRFTPQKMRRPAGEVRLIGGGSRFPGPDRHFLP